MIQAMENLIFKLVTKKYVIEIYKLDNFKLFGVIFNFRDSIWGKEKMPYYGTQFDKSTKNSIIIKKLIKNFND
jgi:hypothetical protein